MFVNKIGAEHLTMGKNCQDYGLEKEGIKLVCDGCSEGKHSEVGAKIFSYLYSQGLSINEIFRKMVDIFSDNSETIKNFLCFTIMSVNETEDFFEVSYCGDGFIIMENYEGNMLFEELSDGEYPKYFAYNYCDPNSLSFYKDGVEMVTRYFSKSIYKNVGVASDGLRYIMKADEELKTEFITLLKEGKEGKMKRFINRNQKIFKDDITIAF